jgi:hypothetical protein
MNEQDQGKEQWQPIRKPNAEKVLQKPGNDESTQYERPHNDRRRGKEKQGHEQHDTYHRCQQSASQTYDAPNKQGERNHDQDSKDRPEH